MNSFTVDFFLGANSEHGFVSHFDQLQDPYSGMTSYLIKGGPGTGKSTVMKRLAERFAGRESLIERIHCSSDPDSLDGVILRDHHAQVVDATPPHALEPRLPGAGEWIVSFYDAFDREAIAENRLEMAQANAVVAGFHRRFCELLRCANLLLDGNSAWLARRVDTAKLERTAQSLIRRELGRGKAGARPGRLSRRMLSAFTPKGLVTYEDTINTLCKKVYVIDDEYYVCSDALLRRIGQAAEALGYDGYLCYSPFHPDSRIEHLLIPELSLGFVTRSRWVPLEGVCPERVIHATRFYGRELLRERKQRLSFCRKTAQLILSEAVAALKQAKAAHDLLEEYYIPHVDFAVVEGIAHRLRQQIG